MAALIRTTELDFEIKLSSVLSINRSAKHKVDSVVANILEEVRVRGDLAVNDFTLRFDKVDISGEKFFFTEDEIAKSLDMCSHRLLNAMSNASQRIHDFHQKQMPQDLNHDTEQAIKVGYRWKPIRRAGLYVPAGQAPLFSSILMNVIPAKVAGVKEIVVSMPTPMGQVAPAMLAACSILGVNKIFKIGGAQAIGAMAYGTERINPVDIIAGPGNTYVASAKKQVFGQVGIDMIAGPSEITIVADNMNNPKWIAADILAQAEHDESAQSILITDDEVFASKVSEEVDSQIDNDSFSKTAKESWLHNGLIIIVDNLEEVPKIIDCISPEHLELAIDYPVNLLNKINNAGAIFLGRYTPEAVGDYIAGPSHVLPTSGTARFSSGLSVLNFLKRTSIIQCDENGLKLIADDIVEMAKTEGLMYHAKSISLRSSKGL